MKYPRHKKNREILSLFCDLVDKYPDMRFSQILLAFGFVKQTRPARPEARIDWQDEFYMESEVVLKRVKQRIEDVEFANKESK